MVKRSNTTYFVSTHIHIWHVRVIAVLAARNRNVFTIHHDSHIARASCIHSKHPHNATRKSRWKRILFIHRLMLTRQSATDSFSSNTIEEMRYSTALVGSLPIVRVALWLVCVCVRRSISIDAFYVRSDFIGGDDDGGTHTIRCTRRCEPFIAMNNKQRPMKLSPESEDRSFGRILHRIRFEGRCVHQ